MKIWLSWSSGKDSAWALHLLRQQPGIEITGLLTTFNQSANRVAMHAVRRQLVEAQSRATAIPLKAFDLPWPCSNNQYQSIMAGACRLALSEGVEAIAFGDLFLEDVRAYREEQLKPTGLRPLFPLWQIPTPHLAAQMIAAGLRARITCLDPTKLPRHFAGQDWSEALHSFMPEVDPCGERGEFHTFAYAGPMFRHSIQVQTGAILERDGFVFTDLTPEPVIRKTTPSDAPTLALLSLELGYSVSESLIEARLAQTQCIFVAELDSQVVGWIDVAIVTHLVSGRYGEIGGMVVSKSFRSQGIGKQLLKQAESWILAQGVSRALVRSRTTRTDTHRFYQREGWTLEKTSAVFHKTIATS